MIDMANMEDSLNSLNIIELNTVWKVLNDISEDFNNCGDEATSEKLDEVLDQIQAHIAYREAEMEALHEAEEAAANKYF